MIKPHRIGTLEEKIGFNKTNKSKECKICDFLNLAQKCVIRVIGE